MRPTDDTTSLGRVSYLSIHSLGVSLILQTAALVFVSHFLLPDTVVQGATSITPTTGAGNLGTAITPSQNVYGITGGESVGSNLFHSFGQFSVGTGDIAQFQTTTLVPDTMVSNILGRVTGGSPSNIFGTVDSIAYYPNANLFLMNPNGILFGPGAQINVGGMAHFTTSDYLRLSNGVRFEALPSAQDALLSTASVAAFGFLGSNPAAITVQGSKLTLANGTGLSLVGGNRGFIYTDPDTGATASVSDGVTITEANLSAPSGQINLASVASPGEILYLGLQPAPNINGQSFTNMGNIKLSQGTILDVSSDASGTVRIRSGQLEIIDSTLSADTDNLNGAPTAINLNINGNISITDTRGLPVITARTSGDGNSGLIDMRSSNLQATSTSFNNFALIESRTFGAGRGGDITLTATDTIHANGGLFLTDSGTGGPGNGGNIIINATTVQLENIGLSTGDFIDITTSQLASGAAGNLTITADRLQLNNSIFDSGAFLSQTAGDVTLNVHEITATGTQISALGFSGGGAITINTDSVVLTETTTIENNIVSGQGGGITINARVVELTNGAGLVSTTFGDGQAGNISITATDHFTMAGSETDSNPTGLFSNSVGELGSGNAGSVIVTTPKLEMSGGARINTITEGSGRGGDVIITTSGDISISGEYPFNLPEPIFSIGTIGPSGIFTTTRGSDFCIGTCGDAGHISITAGSLNLGSGAQIDSGTASTGRGGDTIVHATNEILMSGTLRDGSPVGTFSRTIGTDPGSGSGGNITLTAGQSFTISTGASVSASSTGPGNTGNIQIDAGNQFAMTNSSVITEANQASGGAIKITTNPSGTVQLTNSTISASVLDGTGGGGSVDIDPLYVILLNSQILARADQGPGGNITINITNGGLFLPDANSVVSASSGNPANGTVTIQSPNAPGSGKIHPLGKIPLEATSLLNQHCAALAGGEFSSFTVAGRNSLPTEPSSWLTSPLYAAGVGLGVKAEGGKAEGERLETPPLSLRQIAPAGFLTQAFAVDWSAGCQS
jgi:filamentous hemagglutinin family protein